MRTGRAACRTYISDDFSLTDTLAGLEAFGIFRKMKICSRIYGIMPDPHGISTGSFVLHAGHGSVSDRHYRSTLRSCIIDSEVGTIYAVYGV